MSKECRYIIILLKSGAAINTEFKDEISAREKLGELVSKYAEDSTGIIVFGDTCVPTMLLAIKELAAAYINAEPRR